jgi:hypothetical protein
MPPEKLAMKHIRFSKVWKMFSTYFQRLEHQSRSVEQARIVELYEKQRIKSRYLLLPDL